MTKTKQKPPKISPRSALDDAIATIDTNSDLTDRETKVLELHFAGMTLSEAVKRAGYKSKDPQTRVYIGHRILQKYECQAGGKEIFRRVGLGEVRLALRLRWVIEELERTYRETGQLAALKTLKDYLVLQARCLGLQREVVEGLEAPVIVIGGQSPEAVQDVEVVQEELRSRMRGQGQALPAPGQRYAEIAD